MIKPDDPRLDTLQKLLTKARVGRGEIVPDELAFQAGFTKEEIWAEKEAARKAYEGSTTICTCYFNADRARIDWKRNPECQVHRDKPGEGR